MQATAAGQSKGQVSDSLGCPKGEEAQSIDAAKAARADGTLLAGSETLKLRNRLANRCLELKAALEKQRKADDALVAEARRRAHQIAPRVGGCTRARVHT